MQIKTVLLLCVIITQCWQIESNSFPLKDFLQSALSHIVENPIPPTLSAAGNICTMTVSSHSKTCSCSTPEVDCSHLGIENLPPEISFPQNITIANFQGNMIEDVNDDTFYDGGDIVELDLSHNAINFVSITAFLKFTKLVRLTLSHNALWNIPVKAFEGLQVLKELDLSHNDVPLLFPDLFKPLKNLKILSLAQNPLMTIQQKQFQYLPKLEKLNLEDTLLSTIPDSLFAYTPNLRYLSLSDNQIGAVPSGAFRMLNMIHTLILSGNPIEIIPSRAFHGMPYLMVLYLNRMPKLTAIDKFAFGDLKNLRELQCSYNFHLNHIDEDAFRNGSANDLVTVQQLFLRQNNLMYLPENLQRWNSEMELHVRGNPWYCDCQMQWMALTKLKNKFQEEVWCSRPFHLRDRVLSNMHPDELTCALSYFDIIIISCSLVIGLLIILLIVAFLVWRRHFSGISRTYFRISKKSDSDDVVYEKRIDT